ncbi:MAG: hypothetical protein L3J94_11015 [Gammaproteobacteria bacterium]|nr:hypothetical protein [Gammaproteobacteria bacterium]
MIITIDKIIYTLAGKQMTCHKLLMAVAKFKGVPVSDPMRKNISNFSQRRNKPSETTLKNFKTLLKEVANHQPYSDDIDNISLLDDIDLSTFELQLKYNEE